MRNCDDGDLMQVRKDHSISLLSRFTIPSSLGDSVASPPSNGPGLKTGTSLVSGFRSGIVTQDRLFPGLGPSSIGLAECEAVNKSNYKEKRRADNQHTIRCCNTTCRANGGAK